MPVKIDDGEDIDEEDRQDLKYQMIDFCEDLIRSIGNKFDFIRKKIKS